MVVLSVVEVDELVDVDSVVDDEVELAMVEVELAMVEVELAVDDVELVVDEVELMVDDVELGVEEVVVLDVLVGGRVGQRLQVCAQNSLIMSVFIVH